MSTLDRKREAFDTRTGESASFETSDLNLASFLRCRNFLITEMAARNGRTLFVFEESAGLRGAILDFANDGAVPVRSFCNTLRDLKALTHARHHPAGGHAGYEGK